MASDLTERLAAKLEAAEVLIATTGTSGDTAVNVSKLLPLLLSEPELVAGLPPEVKRGLIESLLTEQIIEDYKRANGFSALHQELTEGGEGNADS